MTNFNTFHKEIGVSDDTGIFGVCRAEIVLGKTGRCDTNRMGPVGNHLWIESENKCDCGKTEPLDVITNDHYVTVDMIYSSYPVIAAVPYGFVRHIELNTPEQEDKLLREPHNLRTYQELLRYLVEWAWAYDLGSREATARVCYGMLSVMDMPSVVYDWVINEVPFGRLGRFLSGNTDAAARTTDTIPPLTTEAQEWLEKLINYSIDYETGEI
jgi:hypothetical protein